MKIAFGFLGAVILAIVVTSLLTGEWLSLHDALCIAGGPICLWYYSVLERAEVAFLLFLVVPLTLFQGGLAGAALLHKAGPSQPSPVRPGRSSPGPSSR